MIILTQCYCYKLNNHCQWQSCVCKLTSTYVSKKTFSLLLCTVVFCLCDWICTNVWQPLERVIIMSYLFILSMFMYMKQNDLYNFLTNKTVVWKKAVVCFLRFKTNHHQSFENLWIRTHDSQLSEKHRHRQASAIQICLEQHLN